MFWIFQYISDTSNDISLIILCHLMSRYAMPEHYRLHITFDKMHMVLILGRNTTELS